MSPRRGVENEHIVKAQQFEYSQLYEKVKVIGVMDVNVHTRELYDIPYLADWEGFSVVCAGTNTGRSVPSELASLRCTQPTLRSRQTRDKGPATIIYDVSSDGDEAFKIAKDLLLKVMFLVHIRHN